MIRSRDRARRQKPKPRRFALALLLAVGIMPPARGSPSALPESRDPGDVLAALNDAFALGGLPSSRPVCEVGADTPGGQTEWPCLGPPPVAPEPRAAGVANASFTLARRGSIQTPRGLAAVTPLPGAPAGSILRVHERGDVGLVRPDGSNAWVRASMSFFPDWDLETSAVPWIPMGVSAVDPFFLASERAFTTGDLTGDDVAEVITAHFAWIFNSSESRFVSVVTVLDGSDGHTLWHRPIPGYVMHVVLDGRTLVITNITGDPVNGVGELGSTSRLIAYRFDAPQPDAPLSAEEQWRYDTATQWAVWLAAEPAGSGTIAVAWTDTPLGHPMIGDPGDDRGHVLLVDLGTGRPRWSVTTKGYPRTLRYDPGREVVVVHEQADPFIDRVPKEVEGEIGVQIRDIRFEYRLLGLSAADGSIRGTVYRPRALLLGLRVADIWGDAGDEWIVSDLETTDTMVNEYDFFGGGPSEHVLSGRVATFDGGAGTPGWEEVIPAEQGYVRTYGLAVTADSVVAASFVDSTQTELRALRAEDGSRRWARRGDIAWPGFVARSGDSILAATRNLALRRYALADGATELDLPLLAEIHAAETFDVDGTGAGDLLVGTESGAVFALDGDALRDDPTVLWRTNLDGPVHALKLADLDGDRTPELVAATGASLQVLRPTDGTLLATRSGFGDKLVTFEVGDLTRDERPEVVVATDVVRAFSGIELVRLWEYRPSVVLEGEGLYGRSSFSNVAITPREGNVVAQYAVYPAVTSGSATIRSGGILHHRVVTLEGDGGEEIATAEQVTRTDGPVLWRSVLAPPALPGASAESSGVAVFRNVREVEHRHLPQVDVHDSATGQLLWSQKGSPRFPGAGATHKGLLWVPAAGLVEYNYQGTLLASQQSVKQLDFAWPARDAEVADFGSLGRSFLTSWFGFVQAYREDAPTGAAGDAPVPFVAEATGFRFGEMTVRDLDADGSQEVIAYDFDLRALNTVFTEGEAEFVPLPHGLAVLEARPT